MSKMDSDRYIKCVGKWITVTNSSAWKKTYALVKSFDASGVVEFDYGVDNGNYKYRNQNHHWGTGEDSFSKIVVVDISEVRDSLSGSGLVVFNNDFPPVATYMDESRVETPSIIVKQQKAIV